MHVSSQVHAIWCSYHKCACHCCTMLSLTARGVIGEVRMADKDQDGSLQFTVQPCMLSAVLGTFQPFCDKQQAATQLWQSACKG